METTNEHARNRRARERELRELRRSARQSRRSRPSPPKAQPTLRFRWLALRLATTDQSPEAKRALLDRALFDLRHAHILKTYFPDFAKAGHCRRVVASGHFQLELEMPESVAKAIFAELRDSWELDSLRREL